MLSCLHRCQSISTSMFLERLHSNALLRPILGGVPHVLYICDLILALRMLRLASPLNAIAKCVRCTEEVYLHGVAAGKIRCHMAHIFFFFFALRRPKSREYDEIPQRMQTTSLPFVSETRTFIIGVHFYAIFPVDCRSKLI